MISSTIPGCVGYVFTNVTRGDGCWECSFEDSKPTLTPFSRELGWKGEKGRKRRGTSKHLKYQISTSVNVVKNRIVNFSTSLAEIASPACSQDFKTSLVLISIPLQHQLCNGILLQRTRESLVITTIQKNSQNLSPLPTAQQNIVICRPPPRSHTGSTLPFVSSPSGWRAALPHQHPAAGGWGPSQGTPGPRACPPTPTGCCFSTH